MMRPYEKKMVSRKILGQLVNPYESEAFGPFSGATHTRLKPAIKKKHNDRFDETEVLRA